MSLLGDIQGECVSKDASISRILRLCLQLASRLKHVPLKEWVLHELNGYPKGAELPSYRVCRTRSRGYFADRFVGSATLDIPMSRIDEHLRSRFSEARLDQAIGQYEALLSGNSGNDLQLPWPMDLALHYGPKISEIQCIKIWQELPRAAMSGMIDTVKTRVLSMVLEIEAENPAAGEIQGVQIPEAKVTQIVNTNIYGQVQNLAPGSPGAVQSAGNQIAVGDTEGLTRVLQGLGISTTETSELLTAIEADKLDGGLGLGKRVSEWLSRIREKANSVGADVAKQSIAGVAVQAILAFLGIS